MSQAQVLFRDALKYYAEQNFVEAIKVLSAAISLHPTEIRFYHARLQAHLANGSFFNAVTDGLVGLSLPQVSRQMNFEIWGDLMAAMNAMDMWGDVETWIEVNLRANAKKLSDVANLPRLLDILRNCKRQRASSTAKVQKVACSITGKPFEIDLSGFGPKSGLTLRTPKIASIEETHAALSKLLLATSDRVDIALDHSAGRVLVANRNFKKGEVVYAETASMFAAAKETDCQMCGKANVSVRCKCGEESFCSKECHQRANVLYHGVVCGKWKWSKMRAFVRTGHTSSAGWGLLIMRAMAMALSLPQPCVITELPQLKFLCAPLVSTVIMPVYSVYSTMLNNGVTAEQLQAVMPTPQICIVAMCKVMGNSFGASIDEFGELSRQTSIYARLSLMRHDCDPNVDEDIKPSQFTITANRAIRKGTLFFFFLDVAALTLFAKGEHLTVSYIRATEPRDVRHNHLRQYWFCCNCTRCEKEKAQRPCHCTEWKVPEVDDAYDPFY